MHRYPDMRRVPDGTQDNRKEATIGIVALIFSLIIVVGIFLLAINTQRNHGPVPPEQKWWAEQARIRREQERAYRNAHGSYRRRY